MLLKRCKLLYCCHREEPYPLLLLSSSSQIALVCYRIVVDCCRHCLSKLNYCFHYYSVVLLLAILKRAAAMIIIVDACLVVCRRSHRKERYPLLLFPSFVVVAIIAEFFTNDLKIKSFSNKRNSIFQHFLNYLP